MERPGEIRFEWDIDKDRTNRRKHGMGFDTAEQVFDDSLALTLSDRIVDGEERWRTIGMDFGQVRLVVIHADRKWNGIDVIRIISARKANIHERRAYESGS